MSSHLLSARLHTHYYWGRGRTSPEGLSVSLLPRTFPTSLPPGPCLSGPPRGGGIQGCTREDTGQPVSAQETEGASVHSWPLAPLGVCL